MVAIRYSSVVRTFEMIEFVSFSFIRQKQRASTEFIRERIRLEARSSTGGYISNVETKWGRKKPERRSAHFKVARSLRLKRFSIFLEACAE